jgi:hypothetical protein
MSSGERILMRYAAQPINQQARSMLMPAHSDEMPHRHVGEIYCQLCREWVNEKYFEIHAERRHGQLLKAMALSHKKRKKRRTKGQKNGE